MLGRPDNLLFWGWIRVPRPWGFRFFDRDSQAAAPAGDATPEAGSRFFQLLTLLFGRLDQISHETPAVRPGHEPDPAIRFVRPQFDTIRTVPAETTIPADLQGRPDDTIVMTFGQAADAPDDRVAIVIADPNGTLEDGDDRLFTFQAGLTEPMRFGAAPKIVVADPDGKPVEPEGWAARFVAMNSHPLPLSVDFDVANLAAASSSYLPGIDPPLDTLELSGDFSAGFTLSGLPFEVGQLALMAGNDYVLAANDDFVDAGELMPVDAGALGADDRVTFDGTAETDGRFLFTGGGGDDFFFGGAGDDWIRGGGGADTLTGGGGGDIFSYRGPTDSSGTDYDTLADFNPEADRIDLPNTVTGFGTSIEGGALSTATFNNDLAAALGNLGAAQAVWFAPDAGDLAGQVFLIVDGNGRAGYQEGEDYVFAVDGAPLADLTGHTDIFI